jgi:dihydrofolate reductase
MRRLGMFMHVTLDGYYADADGDMSWAHAGSDDPELQAFVAANAASASELVFGRRTYEMMASYWPTPAAAAQNSAVAARMNAAPKIVFSRTLERADWQNTRLHRRDMVATMKALKTEPGPDLAILGSGDIVGQLAAAGLIDNYQIMVNPIALGAGRALFGGLNAPLSLRLTSTRTFASGKVLLCYAPM